MHLATKHRPQSLEDVVGQELTISVLNRMVEVGSVPSNLLFIGASGTGKTTVARVLARTLTEHELNVIEIDAASHGSVSEIRSLLETLTYQAGTERRVVILDEAHSMSKEAFNTLLKTMDDTPEGIYFFLLTTEGHKIPETVKTRMMPFTFNKIPAQEIYARLVSVNSSDDLGLADDILRYLAVRAQGSMRQALMLAEKASWSGFTTLQQYRVATRDFDYADRIMEAMVAINLPRVFEVLDAAVSTLAQPTQVLSDLIHLLKDVMIIRAGGTVLADDAALRTRTTLANTIEQERIFHALRALWDIKVRIPASPDVRGDLELTLSMIYEVMTRGRRTDNAPVKEDSEQRVMSLSDLQKA